MSLWMGFGVIWMIVFWGIVIALIVWGIKRLTEKDSPYRKKDPLDIAKERYARGEITKEEFEELRHTLS